MSDLFHAGVPFEFIDKIMDTIQATPHNGIVYVLTNPAMPGLVKIGMTNRDSVDARLKELLGIEYAIQPTAYWTYKGKT